MIRSPRLTLLAVTLIATGASAAEPPRNLGFGLRQVVAAEGRSVPPSLAALAAGALRAPEGTARRQLPASIEVELVLDGTRPMAAMVAELTAAGGRVLARSERWRHGKLRLAVAPARVAAMARMPGVRAMFLATRPGLDVGSVQSQGVAAGNVEKVQAAGIDGRGITIGILSDSFDALGGAAADVASGDLPGPGNPAGYTQPVVVLNDIPERTDEGRAMAQIVADVAPAARLCYATAFGGDTVFADNIRALADPAGPCGAQIIVDDVFYVDEPFFSDGPISQAANEVAAKGVAFFTSAGNANPWGYESPLRLVSDEVGRQRRAIDPVDLSTVPAELTAGGFHNFGTDGQVRVALPYKQYANSLVELQWNDPFDAEAIETDLNILVFDSNGTYDPEASGTDDNRATGRPIEGALLTLSGGRPSPQRWVVIARRAEAAPPRPVVFRLLDLFRRGRPGIALGRSQPTSFGHKATTGTISVAANWWGRADSTELFSTIGPGRLDFDAEGRLLARPLFLQRPDFGAPDGVLTTVPGFARFFGTSASAPHAAGVAALLLQAAGGPGSLTPEQIRAILRGTARPHNGETAFASVTARRAGAAMTVTARGAYADTARQFSVSLSAPPGVSLVSVKIDLKPANLLWFPVGALPVSTAIGFPATAANLRPQAFPRPDITFDFSAGAFVDGGRFQFGLPFGIRAIRGFSTRLGEVLGGPLLSGSPSLLDGAIVRGTLSDGTELLARVRLPLTTDWTAESGTGPSDAFAAYQAVLGGRR